MERREISLEYILRCNIPSLYKSIHSSEGLGQWFADRVTSSGDEYDFYWGRFPSRAKLVASKSNSFVRFVWEEDLGSDYYFEMRIELSPLTKDVALFITDYAEDDGYDDLVSIWDHGVKRLSRALGILK